VAPWPPKHISVLYTEAERREQHTQGGLHSSATATWLWRAENQWRVRQPSCPCAYVITACMVVQAVL